MRYWVLVPVLLALVVQPVATPEFLSGVVISDRDEPPLSNVRITLDRTAAEGSPVVVLTDPFGRFVLPAGAEPRYQLVAMKGG